MLHKQFATVTTNANASPPAPSAPRPPIRPAFSPSASPSASILKRRHLGDGARDSPSPPAKQRRVSFASAVETKLIESTPRSPRFLLQPPSRTGSPRPPRATSPRSRPVRCLQMPRNSATSTISHTQQVREIWVCCNALCANTLHLMYKLHAHTPTHSLTCASDRQTVERSNDSV